MTEQITEQNIDLDTTDEEVVDEQVEATDDEGKKGNPEAAKWRVKFREAEATIATLQARVGDMQAAEVARLATGPGRLHDGADLLLTSRLEDLLDDEGNVDPEVVGEKIDSLIERKPHLARPAFDGDLGIGQKNASTGATWADVIAG